MASRRELLLQRVKDALAAAAPFGGVQASAISRSREVSITRAISPAIVVMPKGTATNDFSDTSDRNAHEFGIEIFVRGDVWDSLADPIDVAAHAMLMADMESDQAPALGSLLSRLDRIGEDFEALEADRTAGTLTVRYRATYLTSKRAIDRSWP